MAVPKTEDPISHVRLTWPDHRRVRALADAKGMRITTWLRMVILERLQKEREHGK